MARKAAEYAAILDEDPVLRDESGQEISWDLELIVRQVMIRMLEERDLSEAKAAKLVGIDQRTLNRFLAGESSGSLQLLETWCTAFETTPIRFLDSHPDVGRRRPSIRIARDNVFDRFRSIFSQSEQDSIMGLLEDVQSWGLFNQASMALSNLVRAAELGRSKGATDRKRRQTKKKAQAP